jgi:CRISPR-associated endonuclease Csn1
MNGQAYISQARVLAYEKHEKDLKILKSFFKKNSMTEYNKMFRQMNDNNYSSYVGSVNYKNKSIRRGSKCNSEEFFKSILKAIKEWDDCEEKIYIEDEIEKGTFLPKQITTSNGVIPNQVHKKELKKILTNAEIYLPFLSSKDESGLTVSERIVEMFSFQIPYYVGPISYSLDEKATTHRNNVWSVRKESGRVYPWNFEKKIDIKKSSENFISNLINHCTYLNGESVLPKNSLLYEKFMVLNELNNLKVNEQKISVETKQDIYNKLFKKGKKVTAKAIVKYLKENGLVDNSDEPALTGIDGDFTNRLANYKKFLEIFETDTLTYEQEQIAENIIYYSTIYGDSKKFLEERIRELYGEVLNEKQIKIGADSLENY